MPEVFLYNNVRQFKSWLLFCFPAEVNGTNEGLLPSISRRRRRTRCSSALSPHVPAGPGACCHGNRWPCDIHSPPLLKPSSWNIGFSWMFLITNSPEQQKTLEKQRIPACEARECSTSIRESSNSSSTSSFWSLVPSFSHIYQLFLLSDLLHMRRSLLIFVHLTPTQPPKLCK